MAYTLEKKTSDFPRLPLDGNIDLTYRCNNTCLHCWLWKAPNAPEQKEELTFDKIRRIVDEARAMGCRQWSISGGEPMLRPDFPEIFDYITRKSVNYSLNTNGTLITPAIAQLLKRKGSKMIALYGATAEVYDAVTRHPGGFEQLMRGFAYLKEAGAGFIVQLIPMRANWHQWEQMQELARSLSPHYRTGAAWLFLSADGNRHRNAEIKSQRLSPRDVIEIDQPQPGYEERMLEISDCQDEVCIIPNGEGRIFAACIATRRDFHIDPYGKMTFCAFIKDPALRYDLKQGTFKQAWDVFIPSLADIVYVGSEWRDNCGTCEKRSDCRWCKVYSYIETGRYSAPIPYLCAVAEETQRFKKSWQENHLRYFQIAGITVRVESDLDFDGVKIKPEIQLFAVDGPGDDNITLRHVFDLPDLKGKDLGEELYRKAPWAISRKNGTWYYLGISPDSEDTGLNRVAVFNFDHTHAIIYNQASDESYIRDYGWNSLSLFPTDQIWLAPLLADRSAVLLHSAAAIVNGQGLLFVGHSEAGKSTTMTLLKNATRASAFSKASLQVEILCDDRNVVRWWENGWRVHGTWSHGDVPDVSSASAPLCGIFFLHHSNINEIMPLTDRKEIWRRLLATLIKPMVTAEWWQKELDVLEGIVKDVPCYMMHFDRSGAIVAELVKLLEEVRPRSAFIRPRLEHW